MRSLCGGLGERMNDVVMGGCGGWGCAMKWSGKSQVAVLALQSYYEKMLQKRYRKAENSLQRLGDGYGTLTAVSRIDY